MKRISFALLFLYLSGCSGIKRHPDSGYRLGDFEVRNPVENLEHDRRRANRSLAAKQLGVSSAGQLSPNSQARLRNRVRANRLKNRLKTDAEKAQYYNYQHLFTSDAEKVRFLSLPDMASRERWAQMKNLASRAENFSPQVAMAIEQKDILKGMNQNAVKKSWGEPQEVFVAGNPQLKNEKWVYHTDVPTPEGFVTKKRILYFEEGRVVGWEQH